MPPRSNRRLSRIVAAAATAASGRPILEPSGDPGAPIAEAPRPTVIPIADDGFDWGSAVVGAGGAAAVLLVAGAGATALSRRHDRVGAIR
jgi:hypothetical protein